jgi:hypothetical protein
LIVLALVLVATKFKAWRHVVSAASGFLLAFIVVSLPVLVAYRSGGVLGFASLNGLTTPFSTELGVSQPPYDIGHLFLDNYIHALVHAYAARFTPAGVWPDYASQYPDYGGYSLRLFLEYAAHFPADMVTRAYASILKVLSPHTRDVALTPINPGLILTLVALAIVAKDAPVVSMTLCLAIVYFSGLGALQFHPRHLFHLEFFSWLAAAIVGITAMRMYRGEITFASFARGVWIPIGALLVAVLLLAGLRTYQQHEVTRLFDKYLSSIRQALTLQDGRRDDTVLLRLTGVVPDMAGGVGQINATGIRGYYLDVSLDEGRCPKRNITLRVAYTVTEEDFSRDIAVTTAAGGTTHLFFPVFSDNIHRFAALEIAEKDRVCLTGVAAVISYKSLPLPLWLNLPSDWSDQHLYQTIAW